VKIKENIDDFQSLDKKVDFIEFYVSKNYSIEINFKIKKL